VESRLQGEETDTVEALPKSCSDEFVNRMEIMT